MTTFSASRMSFIGAPDELAPLLVNDRAVEDYVTDGLRLHPQHPHGTGTVVGYVVRRTLAEGGKLIENPDGSVGIDIAVVSGPTYYASALEIARLASHGGRYAAIDNLYACGCRS
jgi:hypothetical protein